MCFVNDIQWAGSVTAYPQVYSTATHTCTNTNLLCPLSAPLSCGKSKRIYMYSVLSTVQDVVLHVSNISLLFFFQCDMFCYLIQVMHASTQINIAVVSNYYYN